MNYYLTFIINDNWGVGVCLSLQFCQPFTLM